VDLMSYAMSKKYTNQKTFEEINTLPVNRNKFDSNIMLLQEFKDYQNNYIKIGSSIDTDIQFNNHPTVALKSENGADSYVYYDMGSTVDMTGYDFFDLYIYVDNVSNSHTIQVDFMTGQDLSNRYSFYKIGQVLRMVSDNGWRFIRIPKREFESLGGSPNWAQIRYFRVYSNGNAGTTFQANLGKLEAGKLKKGAVSFYFDDSTIDQYENAFPIMEKYGFQGTMAVITGNVGTEGYVTWSQLRELHNAGWILASHGYISKSLATLTEAEMREELGKSQQMLEDHGFYFGSKCLIAPQGSYSPAVDKIAKEYYACVRNYNYGSDDRVTPSMEFPQSHPRYQKYISPYDTDSAETMKGWIDNVIKNKGEFSFAFHIIKTPTPSDWQWSTTVEDFEAVIAYARQKVDAGVLDVVNWKDTMIQSQEPKPFDDNGKQYVVSKKGKPTILTLPIS